MEKQKRSKRVSQIKKKRLCVSFLNRFDFLLKLSIFWNILTKAVMVSIILQMKFYSVLCNQFSKWRFFVTLSRIEIHMTIFKLWRVHKTIFMFNRVVINKKCQSTYDTFVISINYTILLNELFKVSFPMTCTCLCSRYQWVINRCHHFKLYSIESVYCSFLRGFTLVFANNLSLTRPNKSLPIIVLYLLLSHYHHKLLMLLPISVLAIATTSHCCTGWR